MSKTIYDYAIIGAGAAGLHLALAMLEDKWLKDKKILILEKSNKDTNDRTWSYWEKGKGKWDHLLRKSWHKGYFNTAQEKIVLQLAPYQYKMLHAIDFYNYAKEKIANATNIDWIQEEVLLVSSQAAVQIQGKANTYQANHLFDSRIDKGFQQEEDSYYRILQHFKGWEIETPQATFDPDTFVMMDYQIKWKDSASFTYVLPTSSHHALVEFTLFNQTLLKEEDYDGLLDQYIRKVLQVEDYSIKRVEQGVIPMSNYPFHQANQKNITKIGTAGSWVKPSSGYAFKNIEKMAAQVIANLKSNRPPDQGLIKPLFRWYDTLYLDVLSNQNELGEQLFETMYRKNSIQQIFKFLDEETTLLEDLRIFYSFDARPFLKALLFYLTGIRV